jgi:hypothetical protein
MPYDFVIPQEVWDDENIDLLDWVEKNSPSGYDRNMRFVFEDIDD